MEENNKKLIPKRLVLDIEQDLHSQIKIMASLHNLFLKEYVTKAVMKQIDEDKKVLMAK